MRIERLDLSAYGPFSEFSLDFGGVARLELVFGANEAGKSTALRAVRGLLFGIPEQTSDAHRHPASELAIEAYLSSGEGEPLFVRRRRKRKDSLRDRNDTPLPEDVLTRLLGGIDAAAFERLFAFDHERLAASAEEMLRGKGDVGEALFAAGAGSSAVGAVLRELEHEASEIFTPLARTRPLNVLIKDYRALQADLRKARLLPQAYLDQRESLLRAEQEVTRIRAERLRLEAELAKLARIERALPWLARLRAARSELEGQALPALPPAEVSERRVQAERQRDAARSELRHLVAEQARDRERLQRSGALPKIVEVSEATLHALLGALDAVRAARIELPERRAELALSSAELFELASKYGLADDAAQAERLTIRADTVDRTRRFLAQHAVQLEKEQHLRRRREDVARRIQTLEQNQSELSSAQLQALEHASAGARAAHDLDEREREAKELAERLEREFSRARSRLMPSPPEALPILEWQLPSDETLERLARELAEIELSLQRLRERDERASERLRRVEQETQRMQLAFALPSEEDLLGARAARDAALTELVASLSQAGADPGVRQQQLAAAIQRADEIADRLRREATRVGELASLRAEALALAGEREALSSERGALESARATLLGEHRRGFEAVCIEPLPPAEMRAWLTRQREAARLAVELESAHERVKALQSERARLLSLLGGALGGAVSDAEPALLLREVERRTEELRAEQRARSEAERMLASARAEREAVEGELTAHADAMKRLREQLALAAHGFGLARQVPPEELAEMLDGLANLADRLQKCTRARADIATHELRVAEFDAKVLELTQSFAEDLVALPADVSLPALVTRQREALAQAREQQTLREKLTELEQRQAVSTSELEEAEATLADLAATLGLTSPDELPMWEQRAARLGDLRSQLAEAERELLALGDGRSLDELAAEAERHAADEIAPQKREISEELERLEQAAYQARRDAEGLEAGLQLLGGQSAADVAQRLSETAAAIREQARHYAELRVAHSILGRQLAEYRDKNQGPILERASELFARLTVGSFRGLRVGLDAAVLECVRASGQGLAVAELSEGVRYQLYFALRLASLERYLERGQALPLVLDDVFIHWDDERALSGFQVLGELCQRTQVLFFTHHAHLAEVAARALGSRLRRHALPAPERAA
ncbi:MAG: AAA family ATPase [Myxococcota bacterium]